MPSKSQSSLEFTVIISFMFIVFLSFFYVIGNRLVQIREDNDRLLLEDFGDYLKNEVGFASSSIDGYQRSFEVPATLSGRNYSVVINDYTLAGINHTEMVLSFENYSLRYTYVVILPLHTRGSIIPSKNTTIVVKRAENIVYLDTYPIVCGDGILGSTEECEGAALDNIYCSQSPTLCLGNKTGTRDGVGMCDIPSGCKCVEDLIALPDYQCVRDSCNAVCDLYGGCTALEICDLSVCACVPS